MSEIADEYREGNLRVRLFYDKHPSNPRTDWDHLGHMACDVGRYRLGDDNDVVDQVKAAAAHFGNGPRLNRKIELYLKLFHGATVVLPVYAYIHSGITISVGQAFSDVWDSGLAGWTFDTAERRETLGTPVEYVEEGLRAEAQEYDAYLTGMVYGYMVERVSLDEDGEPEEDGEVIEDLWGLYGYEYAHTEARRLLELYAADTTINYDPAKRRADLIRGIPYSDYQEA